MNLCKQAPFVIAEISGNHDGNIDQAFSLIEEAAKAGANAVKLQTFNPEEMVSIYSDQIHKASQDSNWAGQSLASLYKKASTPREWHAPLFSHAKDLGLPIFSSPFSIDAIEFLEDLNCPIYKIASFEITDLELIRRAAATQKPLIISTGMCTIKDIFNAYTAALEGGASEISLLKCTSTYPSDPSDSNIRAIPLLRDMFNCRVGLSDHTLGIGVSIASIAMGAEIIEKHIKLKGDSSSIDSSFALDPDEFAMLVKECRVAYESLGEATIKPTRRELAGREKRRSLFLKTNKKPGDLIVKDDIACLRPGLGMDPIYLDKIIGLTCQKHASAGDPLKWDLFK